MTEKDEWLGVMEADTIDRGRLPDMSGWCREYDRITLLYRCAVRTRVFLDFGKLLQPIVDGLATWRAKWHAEGIRLIGNVPPPDPRRYEAARVGDVVFFK